MDGETMQIIIAIVIIVIIILIAGYAFYMRKEAPHSKGSFDPNARYQTDRCGNLGSDECPHLGRF